MISGIRYRRAASVLWRHCGDIVLLLPDGSPAPVGLSGAGVTLWDLLEEPCTVRATEEALAERYDVDIAEVVGSIAPVIDELVRIRAVETVPG